MSQELKPCPLCAGEAEFNSIGSGSSQGWIQCKACKLATPLFPFVTAAERAWNTRPTDALQASHEELMNVMNMAKPYIRGGQAAESILYDIDDALANAAKLDTTKGTEKEGN